MTVRADLSLLRSSEAPKNGSVSRFLSKADEGPSENATWRLALVEIEAAPLKVTPPHDRQGTVR